MFDVSFFELLVILIVALVVIGPERLPRVARTLGHLVGRLRNYTAQVRADIDRELDTEELKKLSGDAKANLGSLQSEYRAELDDVESRFKTFTRDSNGFPADGKPDQSDAVKN